MQTKRAPSRTCCSHFVSQSPVYYGWIVIIAGTLGLILTSPGQTYGVSPFVEHFIEDLGISRSLISTLFAIGPLAGSLSLPFIGRQVDRRGPRLMVVVIAGAAFAQRAADVVGIRRKRVDHAAGMVEERGEERHGHARRDQKHDQPRQHQPPDVDSREIIHRQGARGCHGEEGYDARLLAGVHHPDRKAEEHQPGRGPQPPPALAVRSFGSDHTRHASESPTRD